MQNEKEGKEERSRSEQYHDNQCMESHISPIIEPQRNNLIDIVEVDEGKCENPDKNLIAGVMYRALLDLSEGTEREGAITWFNSSREQRDSTGFTFKYCCLSLGWDFSVVKQKVNEFVEWTKDGGVRQDPDSPIVIAGRVTLSRRVIERED